jgi:hypothetical protein
MALTGLFVTSSLDSYVLHRSPNAAWNIQGVGGAGQNPEACWVPHLQGSATSVASGQYDPIVGHT